MSQYRQMMRFCQMDNHVHLAIYGYMGECMDGLRLKNARERAGHTQDSLAEFIEIHRRMITRYENGESSPSAEVLARLADALNVSTDYLVGLTDDPTPRTGGGLKPSEQRVLAAMRRGDVVGAIRAILTSDDELAKT